MDSQNVERRDSKKSSKGGGGGGGNKREGRGGVGGNNSSSNGTGKASSGEKQRSHSQGKSGNKAYREREIYKPPSLRSSKNRNSIGPSEQQPLNKGSIVDDSSGGIQHSSSKKGISGGSNSQQRSPNGSNNNTNGSIPQNGSFGGNEGGDSPMMIPNGYALFGNGANTTPTTIGGGGGPSSVPSSPLISNRQMQANFNANAAVAFGLAKRMFNVNAKEFQFLPPGTAALHQQQQQQQQQLSNFLSQFDPSMFYNNSPILASSGCYPLKQSKSSGNMNLLLQQQQQQQQQQAMALQHLQNMMGFNFPGNFQSGSGNGSGSPSAGGANQFNRLSQSKSSGNVPGGGGPSSKPRVRFDDEEPELDDEDFGQLGNYLTALKLNGDNPGHPPGGTFSAGAGYGFQQQPHNNKGVPSSPQPVLKSSLQKSRTGFYLNLYGNQQQQQHPMMPSPPPSKSVYGMNNVNPLSQQQHLHQAPNYLGQVSSSAGSVTARSSNPPSVKRSRSFGPGNHHMPRTSATQLLSASSPVAPSAASHSVYSDFCITKWPRAVQELVTAAVTGVERIPARNWIEMVNGIFEAMLCDFHPPKKASRNAAGCHSTGVSSESNAKLSEKPSEFSTSFGEGGKQKNDCSAAENNDLNEARGNSNGCFEERVDDEEEDDDDNDDDTDLTSAAVHIFLYFIQREKDRTVMESLLNTCFASFQRLSSCSVSNASPGNKSKSPQHPQQMAHIDKSSIARQWCNFLRFLSTLYSQVKLIRRQKQSQQQPGHSMDEMSFSLLALLCDSCLATLRSPQSYTAEMMGCLFTVLTSIGRDMEGTFPLKMKQLLAAVRDALLGIGPYHQQQNNTSKSSSLSPIVQKTLMQLIELHAANWQLPASAVRYYYSSVNKSSHSATNTTNIVSNSTSTSTTPIYENSQLQQTTNHNSSAPSNIASGKSTPSPNNNKCINISGATVTPTTPNTVSTVSSTNVDVDDSVTVDVETIVSTSATSPVSNDNDLVLTTEKN